MSCAAASAGISNGRRLSRRRARSMWQQGSSGGVPGKKEESVPRAIAQAEFRPKTSRLRMDRSRLCEPVAFWSAVGSQ